MEMQDGVKYPELQHPHTASYHSSDLSANPPLFGLAETVSLGGHPMRYLQGHRSLVIVYPSENLVHSMVRGAIPTCIVSPPFELTAKVQRRLL